MAIFFRSDGRITGITSSLPRIVRESSDRLADVIEAHTQELRVLRDVLEEIRSELQYAIQNNKVLYLVVEDLLVRGDEQLETSV